MRVQVKWDNDQKTIIRYQFERSWSWNDLDSAMSVSEEMFNSVPHEVAVIMDFSDANLLPQNALSQIFRAYNRPQPSNLGVNIIITNTNLLKMMMETGRKVLGKEKAPWRLHFVQSEAEAYKIIELAQSK